MRLILFSKNYNLYLKDKRSSNMGACQFCCPSDQQQMDIRQGQKTVQFGGLPNIGNTCYLNSALQVLFSMKKLRKWLVDCGPQTVLIRAIYFAIISSKHRSEKEKLLLQLGKQYLQHKTLHKYNSQQDALDAFSALTTSLIQEDPSIQSLITLVSEKICQCKENNGLLHMDRFYKVEERCQVCKQQLKMRVTEAPQYLIMVPDRKEKIYDDTIQLNMKYSGEVQTYEIISLIKYIGNTKSGHYLAYIKFSNIMWVQINDQRVSFEQMRPKQAFLCVYELKKKTRNIPQPRK